MRLDYNFRCDKILPLWWENHADHTNASENIENYDNIYYPHPHYDLKGTHALHIYRNSLYDKLTWIFIKFPFDCNGGNWQRMLWKENSRLCTCSYCCRTKSMSPLGMSLNNVLRTIHVIRKMVQMKKRWNVCGSK